MTFSALLSDLRQRGVELTAEGDQLRYRAPRGTLRPADLEILREHKFSLLDALREDAAEDLAEAPVIESRQDQEPGAVLITSPKYREVWVALSRSMAEELRAEESARETPRPVLLTDDIAALRGKGEAAIRAALEVAGVFPGAKVIQ